MSVPIKELYNRFFNVREICILGAAPCLKDDIAWRKPTGVTIALNSAFMAYPGYDIHLIANRQFLDLYADDLTRKGIAIKVNSFDSTGYEEEFFYYPSKTKDTDRIMDRNNSLLASYSVLIPALHFALRCNPKSVVLYGVDLRNARHWDAENHKAVELNRFPGRGQVMRHLQLLCGLFINSKVSAINKNSLPVTKSVVHAHTRAMG